MFYKFLPLYSINGRRTERASHLKTRHRLEFDIPLSASTATDLRLTDKAKVRDTILKLRDEGMSYRAIAKVVGLHFTRVRQILQQVKRDADQANSQEKTR